MTLGSVAALRRILVALGVSAATVCPVRAAEPLPDTAATAAWMVRTPAQDKNDYRGAVNFDAAGTGTGQMLYPAPGLLGLFAAVATHAVIVNATRSHQKSQLQLDADKVLLPYQETLSGFAPRDLFLRALAKRGGAPPGMLVETTAAPGRAWLIEAAPVFILTQDQRALVLENTVAVFAPTGAAAPAYQNVVRVVSAVEPEAGVVERWGAEQGLHLKERSAELLARSFEIALAAAAAATPGADPSGAQRTFRYPEGGRERMERAQLVSRSCDRLLLRNLRGWLVSIPARPDDASSECAGSAAAIAVAPSASAAAVAPPVDAVASSVATLR